MGGVELNAKKTKQPRYRRHGGFCGVTVLEAGGPKEWDTIEEFSEYLRTWQGKSKVEMVYWDSKKSKAYNACNKFDKDNPSYVPESVSPFAYKAWVCVRGRRGSENPCRFMVRARFLPAKKKVVCKVLKHTGSGALANGHNHRIGFDSNISQTEDTESAAEEEVLRELSDGEEIDTNTMLRRMRRDPQRTASLMEGWSVAKRRKICAASVKRFVNLLSRPELCDVRHMVEASNVVDLLAGSIRRRRRGTYFENEIADSISDHNSVFVPPPDMDMEDLSADSETWQDVGKRDQKKSEGSKDVSAVGGGLGRSHDENGDAFLRRSVYGARSSIVGRPVAQENVPQSKYTRRASIFNTTVSIGGLARLLDSHTTLGAFIEKIEMFPPLLDQEVRVLELCKFDERQSVSPAEIHFIIKRKILEKLISRVVSYRIKVERRGKGEAKERDSKKKATEVVDEEEAAESYGIKFQMFEKLGRSVVECSTMILSLRVLLDMRRVQEIIELAREGELFIEWVSDVDSSIETMEERKKLEIVKRYLRSEIPLLKAANYQGGEYRSGFGFFLQSFFKLRGASETCRGQWLTSDAIHMGILKLRNELEKELGSNVFILPPLHWDSDTIVKPPKAALKKSKCAQKVSEKEAAENFLRILGEQNEAIVGATPRNLERSVIYTVVNKGGNHWIGLEACIRTRCVLLYDPADTREARDGDGSEEYFSKVRSVIELLLEKNDVPSPPLKHNQWKTGWTHGGQQVLSVDGVNCGVYALEWIKYRVLSSVCHRRALERQQGTSLLREKLRDTSMNVFDAPYMEKARLLIAEYALQEMRTMQISSERKFSRDSPMGFKH